MNKSDLAAEIAALRAEVAVLRAELANRPIVYMVTTPSSPYYYSPPYPTITCGTAALDSAS